MMVVKEPRKYLSLIFKCPYCKAETTADVKHYWVDRPKHKWARTFNTHISCPVCGLYLTTKVHLKKTKEVSE